ncbi:MAG: rhomboid family intramembrane serine protease [Acidiferrobacterales bacterium]|nr:rhomboid family intramembrane serine protease [Acidiferrobacterales bacterium]
MYRRIPVTLGLIATSLFLTLLTNFGSNWPMLSTMLISTTLTGLDATSELELWRLVTPAFIHFNIYHLVFNLLWVLIMGRAIERIEGSLFMVLFFLASAILSNLAEFMMSGPVFGGMSGVVYALFGYIWMQSKFNPVMYRGVFPPAIIPFMLIWFAICWTGLLGDIANFAHTAGLLIGVVWGRIGPPKAARRA